jgi:hypothetical protein
MAERPPFHGKSFRYWAVAAFCFSTLFFNITSANAVAPDLGKFPNLTFTYGSSNTVPMDPPTSNGIGAWTFTSSNTSVATINKTTIIPVSVGTTTITATQASDGTYSAATVSATLTIVRGVPVVGPFKDLLVQMPSSKVVTKTITPPISNSTADWVFTSLNPTVATVDGNVLSILSLGAAPITAVQSANTNFSQSAPITMTVTVTGPSPTIDAWAEMTFFFSDSPATIVPPKSPSNGLWSYVSSDPSIVTFDGNKATFHKSGKAIITANQTASIIWGAASIDTNLTVKKNSPTVGSLPAMTVHVGEPAFTPVPPTSNSTGVWDFESSNPRVASIVDGLIKPISAGTTVITATQEGTTIYNQSAPVTSILTVTPAPVPPVVKPHVSAALKGRILTVKSDNPDVTVKINGNPGVLGINRLQPGVRTVSITFQDLIVFNKKFTVK